MECSIYVGFCAYMLALCGRLEEADRRIAQLRHLTRRQQSRFCVDTVGNGFAADVLVSMYRGDLRGAARRAGGPVPDDPAFAMTAAAAIGQVGLLTLDPTLLQVAAGWAQRGTIPLLRFLPTLLECCRALLDSDIVEAADLAERYWDEAAVVPVSRVQPLPVLTVALLAAGRDGAARAVADEAADLVAGMAAAPVLQAAVHQSRAQLAHHEGNDHAVVRSARELLDVGVASGLRLHVIDAQELLDTVADPLDELVTESKQEVARRERANIGYRFSMLRGEARL